MTLLDVSLHKLDKQAVSEKVWLHLVSSVLAHICENTGRFPDKARRDVPFSSFTPIPTHSLIVISTILHAFNLTPKHPIPTSSIILLGPTPRHRSHNARRKVLDADCSVALNDKFPPA